MSHVNTTPHYGLPIYGENDIINPLTDFNDGNSAIDTALYEIADAQGSEASAISDINVFLGDKELETVAQNLTDAVNEVNTAVGNADTAIGNVAGDVVTLQTAVGDANTGLIHDVGALQTTVGSQGNSITALQGTVGDANSGLVKDVADLATTVGDADSGLVKNVADLTTTVGDANSGLVKDVASLEANNFGTAVNLDTYNTFANCYVAPSDGYLQTNTTNADAYVVARIYGANATSDSDVHVGTGSRGNNVVGVVYVKKGMKLYNFTHSADNYTINFYPFA